MDVANLPRYRHGLTLVELLATLAVVGVSLSILIPSWSQLSQNNRINATVNQLVGHLQYARSTAVTRSVDITLCPTDDGASCSGDSRGWRDGYLVFADHDRNKERASDEPLLHVQGASVSGLELISTISRPAIRFRPDGAAWGSNTTFQVCLGETASAYRAVILHGTGRARTDRVKPDQQAIDCL